MFPPFDEESSLSLCKKIICGLDNLSVKMVQLTPPSEERAGQGIMIGAAICKDGDGKIINLCSVSGISKRLEFTDSFFSETDSEFSKDNLIFVEPVVDSEKINSALAENDKEIHELTEKIKVLKEKRKISDKKYRTITAEEEQLSSKRSQLCSESLKAVYNLYDFHCADGKIRSLNAICGKKLPPTGTGDCSAPKLLNFAFKNNYQVLSLCEVYYGKSNSSKVSGEKYPPCDQRCSLILPSMLGLEILYRDSQIVVVNKQSGVLSVPGRGPDKQDCIVNRFKRLFPDAIEQPSVHRLDMETSGLLVLARTKEAHRELNRQFEAKEVYKEYEAILEGPVTSEKGMLELYFRVDIDNRPHQIWDEVYGKKAVTEYIKLNEEKYSYPDGKIITVTRMRFIPHTGRTHQLRLASADSHGLNAPIIGDTLYGHCMEGERLLLHSTVLEFTHPETGKRMRFENPAPF